MQRTGAILLVLACLGRGTAVAQVPVVPSAPAPSSGLDQRTGSLLSSSGGFAWVSALFAAAWIDTSVRRETLELGSGWRAGTARVAKTFGEGKYLIPGLAVGYGLSELTGLETAADITGHALLATAGAGLVTALIKGAVGRSRPYESGSAGAFDPMRFTDSSFPSGHTAIAFALASTLAHETPDRWSDVVFYGAATLTGLSRVHDDRHWLTDVVAGAGIGILAGRLATKSHRALPLAAGPGGVMVQLEF